MKTLALASAAALALLASAGAAAAGDVTVTLSGVQARGGALYVALQGRDQFMKPAMSGGAYQADPKAGTVTLTIRDVAPGDYAISVLHDQDGDHQMKREPDGRPLEGWAMVRFAGNARPGFDDVKVTVPAGGAAFSAGMRYPN
jgi:uncharacterized protein (DUF2141 family)